MCFFGGSYRWGPQPLPFTERRMLIRNDAHDTHTRGNWLNDISCMLAFFFLYIWFHVTNQYQWDTLDSIMTLLLCWKGVWNNSRDTDLTSGLKTVFLRFRIIALLLMEELLHHLGCIYNTGMNYYTYQLVQDFFHPWCFGFSICFKIIYLWGLPLNQRYWENEIGTIGL